MKTRIPTSIEGLDEKLGGGFPKGSVVLLLSNSETCLRTFFQQIAYNFASYQHRIFYLTITKEPSFIIEEMQNYNWNIKQSPIQDNWCFIDAYTPKLDVHTHDANSKISIQFDLFVSIRQEILPKLKKGDIVIIDLLSDLLLKYEISTVVDFLDIFSAIVRKTNGLIVLPAVKQMHEARCISIVSHFADVVVDLEIDEILFNGKIRFWKMRRARLEPFFIPFSLTERGINVETFERIV